MIFNFEFLILPAVAAPTPVGAKTRARVAAVN
jgi:hypothetical protein